MQERTLLGEDAALGIDAAIGRMSLKKLGRKPEAGFARAGRSDNAGVQVAGVSRDPWAGVHGEQFRSRENDIVFKLGIDEGPDVFFRAP